MSVCHRCTSCRTSHRARYEVDVSVPCLLGVTCWQVAPDGCVTRRETARVGETHGGAPRLGSSDLWPWSPKADLSTFGAASSACCWRSCWSRAIERCPSTGSPRHSGATTCPTIPPVRSAHRCHGCASTCPGPRRWSPTRGGYRLTVDSADLDAWRFEQLLAAAADARVELALRLVDDALQLWRGPALKNSSTGRSPRPRPAARRAAWGCPRATGLTVTRRGTVCRGGRCRDGGAGRTAERERARGLLMEALYQQGRHTGALDVYQSWRRQLAEDHGLEPARSCDGSNSGSSSTRSTRRRRVRVGGERAAAGEQLHWPRHRPAPCRRASSPKHTTCHALGSRRCRPGPPRSRSERRGSASLPGRRARLRSRRARSGRRRGPRRVQRRRCAGAERSASRGPIVEPVRWSAHASRPRQLRACAGGCRARRRLIEATSGVDVLATSRGD